MKEITAQIREVKVKIREMEFFLDSFYLPYSIVRKVIDILSLAYNTLTELEYRRNDLKEKLESGNIW